MNYHNVTAALNTIKMHGGYKCITGYKKDNNIIDIIEFEGCEDDLNYN